MNLHNLIQGSQEWRDHRANYFNASDAAAMLSLSPYKTRSELLIERATGITKEVSKYQQQIFDKGHKVEAMARPIVEIKLGIELYPVVCSVDSLSCSCDGLSLDGKIAWECKQWNKELAYLVSCGRVPDNHMPQLQQILIVTGAEFVFFTVTDGTEDNFVNLKVGPDKAWQEKIEAGWAQFAQDLKNYVSNEINEKPQAEAVMKLPALVVQIKGEVSLTNLPEFTAQAYKYLSEITLTLTTDQDFANAEAQAKECRDIAKTLELTKKMALSQTASIDELLCTIDMFKEKFNQAGLALEKLVKTEKDNIKVKLSMDAMTKFNSHLKVLEKELAPTRLFVAKPDFMGAMKSKRTLKSLHDACDTELARSKIEADKVTMEIMERFAWYLEEAIGYEFLFNDLQSLLYSEYFKPEVYDRINAYKDKLQRKRTEEKKAEANRIERERINTIELEPIQTKIEITPSINKRPSDIEIIGVLMSYFKVSHLTVAQWLRDFEKEEA